MPNIRVCPACSMPFDWEGVADEDVEYCCDACLEGDQCTCVQHDHAAGVPVPSAAVISEMTSATEFGTPVETG